MQTAIEQLKDPATFCTALLRFQGKPFRLYGFQKDIIRETDFLHDKVCIRKGRQVGGSLFVAAAICYYAFTREDLSIILVSKTQRQSGWIARYVREFFESSPYLRKTIDKKRSRLDTLVLNNRTEVYNVTAGHSGATIRGVTCKGNGFLCYDESAHVPTTAVENLYPLATGDCGIIHCSTPAQPSGAFWRACQSKLWKTYKIPMMKSPRVTKNDLALLRESMSPSRYRTEVLAEFASGDDVVFDAQSIEGAIDDSLPLFSPGCKFQGDKTKRYTWSLDVSKIGNDSWVLTIGHEVDKTTKIVAYHVWAGKRKWSGKEINAELTDDPNDIIRTMLKYREQFPPTKVYVDTTSNEFFAFELLNKYLLPVEGICWSMKKKELLIEHLATCFRAGRIRIPRDSDMYSELIAFSYDLKRMEDHSDKKIYNGGEPDDFVASLAMLAQSITAESQRTSWHFIEAR